MQQKSNEIHNNEYIILSQYIGAKNNLLIKHIKCGNEFQQTYYNHINAHYGCTICIKNRKLTKEIVQERSNLLHNNEYEILSDYINCMTKMDILHKVCGNIFQQRSDDHIGKKAARCSICYGSRGKLNKEILQKRSNEIHNNEYTILGDYINSCTNILMEHKLCGSQFLQKPNNHLDNKNGCPECHKGVISNAIEFQKRSNEIHNNEYTLMGEYKNSQSKVLLLHKICGEMFKQVVNNHLSGSRCIFCNSPSKGEIAIRNFLIKNNIRFEMHISFEGCRYKNPLVFDFYLPDYNLCIEFNGKQHYFSVKRFGGDDALKLNIIRDNIKIDFCPKNNLELFIIKYTDYKNIEKILKEKLNIQ